MTNEMIIMNERVRLMNEGYIGTTGREIEYVDNSGCLHKIKEPDEIHTYQVWKQLGYQVRRGSKAITQLRIWKYVEGRRDDDGNQEEPNRQFMKTASFFCRTQCDEITI